MIAFLIHMTEARPIAQREKETGTRNPMLTQRSWSRVKGLHAFKSSRQAYDSLRIGSAAEAKALQAKLRK